MDLLYSLCDQHRFVVLPECLQVMFPVSHSSERATYIPIMLSQLLLLDICNLISLHSWLVSTSSYQMKA